ncbi:MAG: Spy/CpxP family protein refolding chaperone [Calditrichae bacterium]|nr:Spy/CpxP family protein refolding chaperone [Calditrichota bacterium]MCB9058463.1 Spy/CpxP family protein refolding chaperone [Calditrichia bacterium]
MKVTKILSASIISLFLAGSIFAQQGPRNGDMRQRYDEKRGPRHAQMMENLGLNDEQKAEIEKIHTENMKESLQIGNQIGEKEAQLRTLETADKADLDKINKVIDEIGSLRTKMEKMHAQTKQKVRALLTDEQRVKFDAQPGFRPHGPGKDKGPHGKRMMDE